MYTSKNSINKQPDKYGGGALHQCIIINNIQTVPTSKQKMCVFALDKERSKQDRKNERKKKSGDQRNLYTYYNG